MEKCSFEHFEHCLTQVRVVGGEPKLERSIELRTPYTDPIHRLQVELLRREARYDCPSLGRLERLNASSSENLDELLEVLQERLGL